MATNAELKWTGDMGPNFQPAEDQFCAVCREILCKTEIFDLYAREPHSTEAEVERWGHHANQDRLLESARQGCHLCSLLHMQCFNPPSGLLTLQLAYDGNERFSKLKCGIQDVEGSLPGHSLSPCDLTEMEAKELEEDKKVRSARRTVSTASDATLALAHGWLTQCCNEHEECSEQGVFPLRGPRRLLKLSRLREQNVAHLSELSRWTKDVEYLTLSHCWGSGVSVKLTQENHGFFLQNISVHDLPRTFQDAVDLTLRLGYHYLWVDALCILQDSVEDWDRESQAMGYIYGNSVCTIAALDAPDGSSGCYKRRNPLSYVPCKIRTRRGNIVHLESQRSSGLRTTVRPSQMGTFDAPVLHKRGWVVQERVLSPRTLYYSSVGVDWECCKVDVSEYTPSMENPSGRSFSTGRLKLGVSQIFRSHESFRDFWAEENWHEQWWHLVQIYTGCDLTYSHDRWNAILGIASMFKRVSGSSIMDGLWRDCIRKDMLWETSSPCKDRLDNGLPSWSWLSINSRVRLNGLVLNFTGTEYMAEILSLPPDETGLPVPDHTPSNLQGGHYIRIRAPLVRYHIRELPGHGYLSPWVDSGWLDVEVRNLIELGNWLPDFTNIDETEDIWTLHWTNEARGLHGLIVRPFTEKETSWYRIGQFHIGHDDSVEKKPLGELMTIDLY